VVQLPILETERLRIAPFSEGDISERYVGWLNDPDVVRYSEQRHRRHTAGTCREFLASMQAGPGHFSSIRRKADGLHLGNISTTVDPPNLSADLGIMIGEKSAWGQGVGLEAWSSVMRYLVGAGGFRRVTAGCMAENRGMVAVMANSGMRYDYTRQRAFLLDGREIDGVHYVVYAEWLLDSPG
jgi:RimJ/RimL family protein N-acetyltransferase